MPPTTSGRSSANAASTTPHALSQAPIFQGLPEGALSDIFQQGQARRGEKDSYFFIQGDPADRLYGLVEGRVKLCQINPEGNQVGK